jgi:hypothetical protein
VSLCKMSLHLVYTTSLIAEGTTEKVPQIMMPQLLLFCIKTFVFMNTHTHTPTRTHAHTHTHTHIHTHTYIHTYIYIYIFIYLFNIAERLKHNAIIKLLCLFNKCCVYIFRAGLCKPILYYTMMRCNIMHYNEG